MKKSLIYTKGGDRGMTSLVGGRRVAKSDSRLDAYGTVDELNSFIGLLMTETEEAPDMEFLTFVQHRLFTLGAYLATDSENAGAVNSASATLTDVEAIEKEIDRIDAQLPEMKHFVLPGGCRSTALAHVCRTVCRRAERLMYRLHSLAPLDGNVLMFVNRLSDYFFVLGRKECLRHAGKEIIWNNIASV